MTSSKILMPAFQPIVDFRNKRYVAAEVLARWHHDGALISPPQNNEIDWVSVDIETASMIRKNTELCRLFFPMLFINASEELLASDFQLGRWLQITDGIVKSKRVGVVIEITENIPDYLLRKRWSQLKSLDTPLALDDFGDRFSDFSRLTSYPWDYCKFSTPRLTQQESIQAVLYCIDRKIKCIAEQVETQQQSIANLELGLSLQQGYLHQKPATLPQYINKLRVEHEKRNCIPKESSKSGTGWFDCYGRYCSGSNRPG